MQTFHDRQTKAVRQDIPLFPIGFLLLTLYMFIVVGKRHGNLCKGGLLGVGAVLTCLMSITASMGLMFLFGVKVTALTTSCVLIVLGIGVDDAVCAYLLPLL